MERNNKLRKTRTTGSWSIMHLGALYEQHRRMRNVQQDPDLALLLDPPSRSGSAWTRRISILRPGLCAVKHTGQVFKHAVRTVYGRNADTEHHPAGVGDAGDEGVLATVTVTGLKIRRNRATAVSPLPDKQTKGAVASSCWRGPAASPVSGRCILIVGVTR